MSDSSLPEAGARLTLDLSEWESNWSQVIGDADTLQSTIDDLSGSVDIDINMDVPDTEGLDAITELDGESIDTEIDATQSEESKGIVDNLNFLATLEKIKLAIDIAGNVWDFISQTGGNLVNPFLDVEDAVARINAQTGGGTGIADMGQFIRDIQAADLGESVNQIADVVIQAKQLDLPIQDATESALTFTHTWQDVDPTTVVGAWGTALQTGIVDNMQEASDLMTVFFQQGGNIGGDAIQVVQANAQSWADMGLSMADALSLMNSLQSGTGATATDAAKMMQTFDDQFTAAAADPGSQQAKLLKILGIDNPKEAGQAIGADTFNAFADAFSSESSETQDLISGMFFGKGGKKFTGAIGEMTTEGGPFADVVGAAEDAASAIDDSLRGAIDDFVLEINTSISELLASDKLDIPGKVKALKEGFQAAAEVLASGGSIGDALEIGFKIEGADDFIANLERIFGNIGIILLQAVAAVQSLQGVDNTGTLATIAQMGQKQLAFDLQIANPDEVSAIIDQAVTRGVSFEGIGKGLRTALEETINSGDLDDALNLADAIQSSAERNGPDAAKAMEAWLAPFREQIASVQANIDTQNLLADFGVQRSGAADTRGVNSGRGTSIADQWAAMIPPDDVRIKIDDTATAATELDTTTQTATQNVATNWNNLGISMTDSTAVVVDQMEQTAAKVEELDARTATALTENTVTASFQAVAEAAAQSFPSVLSWFGQVAADVASMDIQVSGHVQHLINILHDLQFLSAQVATGVQQAITLGGQLPGGGGTTNNTTNNVTVNNNVPNGAAAASNGYAIASSLRLGGN